MAYTGVGPGICPVLPENLSRAVPETGLLQVNPHCRDFFFPYLFIFSL